MNRSQKAIFNVGRCVNLYCTGNYANLYGEKNYSEFLLDINVSLYMPVNMQITPLNAWHILKYFIGNLVHKFRQMDMILMN